MKSFILDHPLQRKYAWMFEVYGKISDCLANTKVQFKQSLEGTIATIVNENIDVNKYISDNLHSLILVQPVTITFS